MSTGTVGSYTMHHQSCSIFTKGTCTCPPSYKQETAESWHKVHAALLKSVAESQAKLLAGINALEGKMVVLGDNQVRVCKAIERTLEFSDKLDMHTRAIVIWHNALTGRLDAIGAVLAELLSPKQSPQRQSKRRKR